MSGDEIQDTELLHAVMAEATAHIGPVRVDPARLLRARRRHRLSEGGVAAGVLSVALVAATLVAQGGGGATKAPADSQPTKAASSTRPVDHITPRAISVYDSDNGTEGRQTVNQLLNHNGSWQTDQYCGIHPTYSGFRKGTGLIFDLGTATRLAGMTVRIGTPGASLEMWAADRADVTMPKVRPGQPPAGFTKVASATDAGSATVLRPAQPVTTRFVLVWFTALPVSPNPNHTIMCKHDDGRRYADTITAVDFTLG